MLVFGLSFSRVIGDFGNFTYLEFLVPGLIAMSALNNALQNSASSIMSSKFQNDLQDLRVVPLTTGQILMGYIGGSLVRGFLCGALVYVVGNIFILIQTGSFMRVDHPFILMGFIGLGSVFFSCLGIWAAFRARSFDEIGAVTQFIVMPLIYLGGVFYSLESLPPFWQKVAMFNPLVYFINGIRWGVMGQADFSVGLCLAVSGGFVFLGLLGAWRGVKYGNYFRF
jgi:ABC-2 type transport system permease protein